jgi:hypothetical protein
MPGACIQWTFPVCHKHQQQHSVTTEVGSWPSLSGHRAVQLTHNCYLLYSALTAVQQSLLKDPASCCQRFTESCLCIRKPLWHSVQVGCRQGDELCKAARTVDDAQHLPGSNSSSSSSSNMLVYTSYSTRYCLAGWPHSRQHSQGGKLQTAAKRQGWCETCCLRHMVAPVQAAGRWLCAKHMLLYR